VRIGLKPPKRALAAGQFRNHVVVERVHLPFGPQRVDARAVAATVGRRFAQGEVEHHLRHSILLPALVDFPPDDARQPGHRRLGLESRFLRNDRDRGTEIFSPRRNLQRFESAKNVGRPAAAIGDPRRQAGD
jgi:hypothetical protein